MIWCIIAYVAIAAIIYGIITYYNDKLKIEPGVDFAISWFWIITLICLIAWLPFWATQKIAKKLKNKRDNKK